MTIELTYRDLKKIALEGEVTKDGVTITIGRPLVADLTTHPTEAKGAVRWHLDENDPRTKDAWAEPM